MLRKDIRGLRLSNNYIPVIGITGGVGSGKSVVMEILEREFRGAVILADKVGHELMEPGCASYVRILEHFGDGVLMDGSEDVAGVAGRPIDRQRLAAIVFADEAELEVLNGITHRAIREEIVRRIDEYRCSGDYPFVALEAALLIEGDYGDIIDQLWYVFVKPELRIQRLMSDRGYSLEKCRQIMSRQLPDDVFFKHADVVIDNNASVEDARVQVKEALKREFNIG